MIPFLKDLLYDPKSFANFYRTGIFLLAELVPQVADVGTKGWWALKVVQGLSLAVKAGDKNTAPAS